MDSAGILVFDVNDFDEAFLGHFTWDLRRMAASLALLGFAKALSDDAIERMIRRVRGRTSSRCARSAPATRTASSGSRLENTEGVLHDVLLCGADGDARRPAGANRRGGAEHATSPRGGRAAARGRRARARSSRRSRPTSRRSPTSSASTASPTRSRTWSGARGSGSARRACPRTTCSSRARTHAGERRDPLDEAGQRGRAASRVVDDRAIREYFLHQGHRTGDPSARCRRTPTLAGVVRAARRRPGGRRGVALRGGHRLGPGRRPRGDLPAARYLGRGDRQGALRVGDAERADARRLPDRGGDHGRGRRARGGVRGRSRRLRRAPTASRRATTTGCSSTRSATAASRGCRRTEMGDWEATEERLSGAQRRAAGAARTPRRGGALPPLAARAGVVPGARGAALLVLVEREGGDRLGAGPQAQAAALVAAAFVVPALLSGWFARRHGVVEALAWAFVCLGVQLALVVGVGFVALGSGPSERQRRLRLHGACSVPGQVLVRRMFRCATNSPSATATLVGPMPRSTPRSPTQPQLTFKMRRRPRCSRRRTPPPAGAPPPGRSAGPD